MLDVAGDRIRVDGAPCQGTTATVDTIRVEVGQGLAPTIIGRARAQKINLRQFGDDAV